MIISGQLFQIKTTIFTWCITVSCLFVFSGIASGDSWEEPDIYWYYSESKSFAVKVIPPRWSPTKIEENTLTKETVYFTRYEVDVPREMRIADKDIGLTKCTARLYRKGDDGKYAEISGIALVNKVLPVEVIISDTGKYIATLDNWGSYGHGDNVVVIYDGKGKLLFKYSLEDILNSSEIQENVSLTVSSRMWLNGRPQFDEKNFKLVLTTRAGRRLISLINGEVLRDGE